MKLAQRMARSKRVFNMDAEQVFKEVIEVVEKFEESVDRDLLNRKFKFQVKRRKYGAKVSFTVRQKASKYNLYTTVFRVWGPLQVGELEDYLFAIWNQWKLQMGGDCDSTD